MSARLLLGDSLDVLRTLDAESVDAMVTDPPYGLSAQPDIAEVMRHWLAGDKYEHGGGGFMGKKWDSFVPGPEYWREAYRVLKPGAHILVFAGTRTVDLMSISIRFAGFEVRDMIVWLHGQGFPKSLNLPGGLGTALKPAMEPIIMARKPLGSTVAECVLRHGTGALNIDQTRIKCDVAKTCFSANAGSRHVGILNGGKTSDAEPRITSADPSGRWPANLTMDAEAAALLDEQSGESYSTDLVRGNGAFKSVARGAETARDSFGFSDSGGASRFFKVAAPDDEPTRFMYTAKPARSERDIGCDGLPAASGGEATGREDGSAGTQNPRAGAGRNGGARNIHPTVKPVDLMRWLCRLITPRGGLVLDPFMGSGTTGVACMREGFQFIGIEREAQYMEIARRRIVGDAPLLNRAEIA